MVPADAAGRDLRRLPRLRAARPPRAGLPRASAAPISAGTRRRGLAGLILLETNTQPGMTPTSLPRTGGAWPASRFPDSAAGSWRTPRATDRPARAPRRDPAPPLAYRMQRLWLTPLFRRCLRIGLPVAASSSSRWRSYFGDADRRAAIVDAHRRAAPRRSRPRPDSWSRMLRSTAPRRRSPQAIREIAGARPCRISSFDLDLEAMRRKVEALDAVAAAERPGSGRAACCRSTIARAPGAARGLARARRVWSCSMPTGHRVAALTQRGDAGRPAADRRRRAPSEAVPEALALIAAAGAAARPAARAGADRRAALGRGAGPRPAHPAARDRSGRARSSG